MDWDDAWEVAVCSLAPGSKLIYSARATGRQKILSLRFLRLLSSPSASVKSPPGLCWQRFRQHCHGCSEAHTAAVFARPACAFSSGLGHCGLLTVVTSVSQTEVSRCRTSAWTRLMACSSPWPTGRSSMLSTCLKLRSRSKRPQTTSLGAQPAARCPVGGLMGPFFKHSCHLQPPAVWILLAAVYLPGGVEHSCVARLARGEARRMLGLQSLLLHRTCWSQS